MGTARMSHDPQTSVLNKWNRMHTVPYVFVTDGSCMTSSGTQNPSITYMALTARAVDYAHKQVQAGELRSEERRVGKEGRGRRWRGRGRRAGSQQRRSRIASLAT